MLGSISGPFGTVLKHFRKRQRLTQQQLAEAAGVHRNTIGRWEEGSFLPESKALVLALARCLHLDEQEALQLLEASLIAPMPVWSVPYPRNPFFTGREETLKTLHEHLRPGQQIALTQSYALHGLGGIGKTQLALEYAYRYALEYRAIFWIGAETIEQIHTSLLRIAERLDLPEHTETDQQRIVVAVQRWLETRGEWLLVWDNLEDLDLLAHFLSPVRRGAVLITTRHQALGILTYGIELEPMEEEEEAMLFLLRRAKILGPEATGEQLRHLAAEIPAEYAAASEMITSLGGLPLALDQAGAYIEETACGLVGYLRRYEQQSKQLLNRRGTPGRDHPQSVATTFWLASEQVEQVQHEAAELLYLCAFLHAEAIPEELFGAGAAHLGPELSALVADPFHFDQAIIVLRSLSLLQRQPETRTLSIHRLVQTVLRERMSTQEQTLWLKRAIRALNAAFPETTHDTWKECERLLPHVLMCAATILDQFGDLTLMEVLGKAANYLRERALHEQARPLYQQALRVGEQVLGTDHLMLVPVLSGLARLYSEQGHYEQAEPFYQQALHIGEQIGGAEHAALTNPLSGLGRLRKNQGNAAQAEVLYQRALLIGEQTWGSEHPFVAITLTNLASLSKDQGNYEQAERLLKQALHIQEQILGFEHPERAVSLNSLAIVYWKQGRYEEAESCYQQALHIREQTSGPEHPLLAQTLNNLAIVYAEQGRYGQAEPLFQRALHICEQVWGPEHPQVATSRNNLGELYLRQEKYEQAEPLFQHTLQIGKRIWGPKHPDLASSLNMLAELYLRQEKYEQAEPLFQQALHIWEQIGGLAHPQVAVSLNGLANLALRQGNVELAKSWFERALCIREESLGPHHPETAQTLHDLALSHQKQGNLSEATALAERALLIRIHSLGDAHLSTVTTRMLCTQLLQEQACVQETTIAGERREEMPGIFSEPQQVYEISHPCRMGVPPSNSEDDPLRKFLDACCELHPRAWCRSVDLWQAYERWGEKHRECFPLSRGAFIAQLKAHGCRADRTKTERIWRGIALVKKER